MQNKVLHRKKCMGILMLTLVVIVTFLFIININTPMMGEDFALISFYPYHEPSSVKELIQMISQRIINQATQWNIRIGEQISIIFGSINIWFYYIGNTMITFVYIVLIPTYAFGKKFKMNNTKDILIIIFSFCIIILFQPVLGEIFFWRTGSSNYLWAMCILLIFALPLRLLYEGTNVFNNKKYIILLHTILGFFAGLTNENTVIVFIVLYIGIILFRIRQREKIFIWIWSSFTTLILGFCVMFFAPSTKIRMRTYNDIFGIKNITINDYFNRALNITYRFFNENIWLVGILAIVTILYVYLNYNKIKQEVIKKKIIVYKYDTINIAFLLASAISAAALVGAPYVETRAFFLIDFFMMCSIIYFSTNMIEKYIKKIGFIIKVIMTAISILTILCCVKIYIVYNNYNKFVKNNELIIEIAKNNNDTDVYISPYKCKNNRILNTREDYLQSNLKYIESYYGIKVFYNMEELYSYNDTNEEFKDSDFKHGVDYINYDSNNDRLQAYGWAALEEQKSDENIISILLKKNDKIYKFETNKVLRKDVGEFYKDNRYDESGFSLDMHNITDIIPKDAYILGICITDNKGINYVTYTDNQIEIK